MKHNPVPKPNLSVGWGQEPYHMITKRIAKEIIRNTAKIFIKRVAEKLLEEIEVLNLSTLFSLLCTSHHRIIANLVPTSSLNESIWTKYLKYDKY